MTQESAATVAQAVDFEGSLRKPLTAALREKLGALKGVGGNVLEAAVDRVVDHAAELLDGPLAGLLAGAWARYPDIQALCDARKHPHDRETMAELANHRFEWKHEPRIDIAIGELPALTIPLGISVGVTMAGGVLVVRGGRLAELRAGKGGVGVRVSLGDKEIARKDAELQLPRVLHFPAAAAEASAREAVPVGRIATPVGEAAGS
jgi:hypothetical protein